MGIRSYSRHVDEGRTAAPGEAPILSHVHTRGAGSRREGLTREMPADASHWFTAAAEAVGAFCGCSLKEAPPPPLHDAAPMAMRKKRWM